MVGALADWFAVTALFRHPLGIPIPHTAIIPRRKDEIGTSLGEFVETNFLSADVVRNKLESTKISAGVGSWLAEEANAERVGAEGARLAVGILKTLSDSDVQEVISDLARRHMLDPDWGPPAGEWLSRVVGAGAHHTAVDLAASNIRVWLDNNEEAFEGLVSKRLPSWVPKIAHRLVDDTAYKQAQKFVADVETDQNHPARSAIDNYLAKLAVNLQHDPETQAKLEDAKSSIFDSPRVRSLAAEAWNAAKTGLISSLEDDNSMLRVRITRALSEFGTRLRDDAPLSQRLDRTVTDVAVTVVERYRHSIAGVITDTVEKWDPVETTEKIELLVGKDLQYIRLNGTIVGALAGLAIYTIAHALFGQ